MKLLNKVQLNFMKLFYLSYNKFIYKKTKNMVIYLLYKIIGNKLKLSQLLKFYGKTGIDSKLIINQQKQNLILSIFYIIILYLSEI